MNLKTFRSLTNHLPEDLDLVIWTMGNQADTTDISSVEYDEENKALHVYLVSAELVE